MIPLPYPLLPVAGDLAQIADRIFDHWDKIEHPERYPEHQHEDLLETIECYARDRAQPWPPSPGAWFVMAAVHALPDSPAAEIMKAVTPAPRVAHGLQPKHLKCGYRVYETRIAGRTWMLCERHGLLDLRDFVVRWPRSIWAMSPDAEEIVLRVGLQRERAERLAQLRALVAAHASTLDAG